MSERVRWSDTLRGAAILLVVLLHSTLRVTDENPGTLGVLSAVNLALEPFRMPSLMFLSGLFLPRSLAKPPRVFLAGKLRHIGWPYLVWSVLFVTPLVASGAENWAAFLQILNPYDPPSLWYLYYLLLFYGVCLLVPTRARVVLALAGWVLSCFVADEALLRFLYLFGFFVLGDLAARHSDLFQRAVRNVPTLIVSGALAVSLSLWVVLVPDHEGYRGWTAPAAIGTIVVAIWLARALSRTMLSRPLQWVGRDSIVFYASHYTGMRLGATAGALIGLSDPWLLLAATFGGAIGFAAVLTVLRSRLRVVAALFSFPARRSPALTPAGGDAR